jgi:hypothetical protein
VTDIFAQQVTDTGLVLIEATECTGAGNFPRMQSKARKYRFQTGNRKNRRTRMTLMVSGTFRKNTTASKENMRIYTLEGKQINTSPRLLIKKTTAVFIIEEDVSSR